MFIRGLSPVDSNIFQIDCKDFSGNGKVENTENGLNYFLPRVTERAL